MKDKAALVIAAIMLTSMAYALSTTSVSATHTSSATIAPDLVREDKTYIFKLTVKNETGDDIKEVSITAPTGFTIIGGITKIPKDNIVGIDNSTDYLVAVQKDEWVQLTGETSGVILPENTEVIRKKGENVLAAASGKWYILDENAKCKIVVGKYATVTLPENENLIVRATDLTLLSVAGDNVKLVNTTEVVLITSITAKLTENTLVYLPVAGTTNATAENLENILNLKEDRVDIQITPSTNEDNFALVKDTKAKEENVTLETLAAGVRVKFPATAGANENVVTIPAGTKVELPSGTGIRILENTKVIRPVDNLINIRPDTLPNIENVPAGWSWTPNKWTGIAENVIAAGKDLDFPVAIKTPPAAGEYDFTILTKDVAGYSYEMKTNKITVDNTTPSVVELTVDKDYVSKAASVTITLKVSEDLVGAPLVYVQQGYTTNAVTKENAKENFRVTMTLTDAKTWKGTFTTIDAVKTFDNYTKIWVENMVDAVDHVSELWSKDDAFFVDTLAPPVLNYERDSLRLVKAENLMVDITDLLPLTGKQTNIANVALTGRAVDNVLGDLENKAGLKVEVLLDDVVVGTTTSLSDNTFNVAVTLNEGLNTIKVRVTDKAGNVGAENVVEWFCDTKKPVFSAISIAGKPYRENMLIKENKPTIKLTIADPGYAENLAFGIENSEYKVVSVEGYPDQLIGFSVQLDNTDLAADDLVNAKPWARGLIEFENVLPVLPEGDHYIFVIAGDNAQQENKILMRFKVDVTAPLAPVYTISTYPGSTDIKPQVLRTTRIDLRGTGEAGATLTVYTATAPDWIDKVAKTVTVGPDGVWSTFVDIKAGVITKVQVTQTDEAGNESSPRLFGYLMTDATPPTISKVTIDDQALTELITDKSRVIIAGVVNDDVAKEIELRIDYAGTTRIITLGAGESFSQDVPLATGINIISLRATDEAGNKSGWISLKVERVVTPMGTYAIILVIIALVLAAIAILRRS